MPWNQDQDNNPWGKKPNGAGGGGNNQTPPDLDEMMKRLNDRFGGFFGGGNNKDGQGGGEVSKGMVMTIIGLAFTAWMASGLYIVAADEQAVVLQFGQNVEEPYGPGLHWHLPYPIETVEKVPTLSVQRLTIGLPSGANSRNRNMNKESLMLTKDENIVDITFVVLYQINNIQDYLFKIDASQAVATIHDAAESSIRMVIGSTLIDDVMTDKKADVELATKNGIQDILDSYQAGILITSVNLQDVQPPEQVSREFKDVASAREDKERAKNEAEAYANSVIPNARGDGKKMILEAEAYAKEVEDRAIGEADRFNSLYQSYRLAPEVTRKRLYLETMEQVLAGADKVIVDSAVAKQVMPYLPLNRAGKVEVK
ncbi:MAG: FtsH protease activity modulator HflK [Mariprofundaceae bacterium]|nr:FtsH protease activity modulator HflK [Mariprofundaceae bacterium]